MILLLLSAYPCIKGSPQRVRFLNFVLSFASFSVMIHTWSIIAKRFLIVIKHYLNLNHLPTITTSRTQHTLLFYFYSNYLYSAYFSNNEILWHNQIMFDPYICSQIMHDPAQYNSVESAEIRRRGAILLLYLLRSPMYDKFTK
jgi:hypothetical protein